MSKKILLQIQRLIHWISQWFQEEYQLDIWLHSQNSSETQHHSYTLKSFSKVTATHIKGKTPKGMLWELKTVEPFDYRIQRKK